MRIVVRRTRRRRNTVTELRHIKRPCGEPPQRPPLHRERTRRSRGFRQGRPRRIRAILRNLPPQVQRTLSQHRKAKNQNNRLESSSCCRPFSFQHYANPNLRPLAQTLQEKRGRRQGRESERVFGHQQDRQRQQKNWMMPWKSKAMTTRQ